MQAASTQLEKKHVTFSFTYKSCYLMPLFKLKFLQIKQKLIKTWYI